MADLHRERGANSWFDELTMNGDGTLTTNGDGTLATNGDRNEFPHIPFVLSLSKDDSARRERLHG